MFICSKMKLLLRFLTAIIVASLLTLFVFDFLLPRLNPKIGQLSISVNGQKAQIFLDGRAVGAAPFYSKTLPLGEHKVAIKSSSNPTGYVWSTETTLSNSTISTIDLDLGPSQIFTAGEVLYFQPGATAVNIITTPAKARVVIDDQDRGESPLSVNLSAGVHQLLVKKDGFLTRTVGINIEPGYKLMAKVYLALDPFTTITKLESTAKASFFLIRNESEDLSKDVSNWVSGLDFLQKNLPPAQTRFDALVDNSGKVYTLNQTEWKNKKQTQSVVNIGYLAKANETRATAAAQSSWVKIKADFN